MNEPERNVGPRRPRQRPKHQAEPSGDGCVDPPLAGDTPERVAATVFEVDARAHDQVLDCARDDDLSGLSERCNASADVHGDATDVVADQLALTSVYSGAKSE